MCCRASFARDESAFLGLSLAGGTKNVFRFSRNGLMAQGTQRFLTYRGASLLQEQTMTERPAWKSMTLPSRPCRFSCPVHVRECWVNPKALLSC